VAYVWTPVSAPPQLLPWLVVLVLLVLRPNRTARAWWIWLPPLTVVGLLPAVRSLLEFIPAEPLDLFSQTFNSLAFGLAAAWLLMPFLRHRLRFLAFLRTLATLAAFSGLAFLVRQDWDESGLVAGFLVFVGLCVLVVAVALSLAGLMCHRQYRPLRLSLWLAIYVLVLWLVIVLSLFLMAVLRGGGGPWLEFLQTVFSIVAVTFITVLPFFILAFANGFFRDRLKGLLHLQPASPPPVLTSITPPPIIQAAGQT